MITKRFDPSYGVWVRVAAILLAVALLLRVGLGVWNTFTPQTTADAVTASWAAVTQTSTGGQVTVTATLNDSAAAPTFTIALETHAVDLDGYDLAQLAVLRTAQGSVLQPTSWDAPKGGHHRSGTLTFPATTADGRPSMTADTREVELIIRDIAGVPERTLTWTR